jgi:hypothetical protein
MQHRGFAGDGKKLVAGGADPGAGLSAAGYSASDVSRFRGFSISRFPGRLP